MQGLHLVLFTLAVVSQTQANPMELMGTFMKLQKCVTESDVMTGFFEHAKEKGIQGFLADPGKNFKCFMSCIMEEFGVFQNGVPNKEMMDRFSTKAEELMNQVLPSTIGSKWKAGFEECNNKDLTSDAEECNGIWTWAKCMVDNDIQTAKNLLPKIEMFWNLIKNAVTSALPSALPAM